MADPPFEAGFAFQWFGCRGLARKGTHTRPIPRVPRTCPIIANSSTRQAVTLARRDGTRLDDSTGPMAFSGSEQSKNGAGEMVPLYAARVQDLGPTLMVWTAPSTWEGLGGRSSVG